MLIDTLRNLYSAAAYCGLGLVLMTAAFAVIDVLTPGDLRRLMWFDRNRNACILVGSNTAAIALVIVASAGAVWAGRERPERAGVTADVPPTP